MMAAIVSKLVFPAVALAILSGVAPQLAAAGIIFNDLGGCSPNIPDPYHALTWSSNFQVECNSDYASSYGNSYGAASGFAATNGGAPGSGISEISITSGAFDFLSADFSAFAGSDTFQSYTAESLAIYGYRPGDSPDSPTYTGIIDLDPTQYIMTTLNFTGIDHLILAAGTGPAVDRNTIFGADGLSWLMTDVDVNVPTGATPEPASALLFGSAVALLLLRRKSITHEQQKERTSHMEGRQ